MTPEEFEQQEAEELRSTISYFEQQEAELLARLPEELRPTISYMAYERGHEYGREEVLSHVRQMVDDLEKPVQQLINRVKNG